MKKNNETAIIVKHIYDWLGIYLPQMRSCSPHTRKAYADALRLFVDFLEKEKSVTHTSLTSKCFCQTNIEEWMMWLKNQRGCSNSTCNHRLGCLRSFLKYIAHKDVRFIETENNAMEIKCMKTPPKGFKEVTKSAIKALFAVPDLSTKIGKRDFALFTVMYNTAARINEILSLKIGDLHLNEDNGRNYVIIWGKGSKLRTVYLLPEVVKIIKSYIKQFHGESIDENWQLFYASNSREKRKLSQEAVNKRLKTYASIAHEKCPEMPVDLHCHDLRSARATHWLEEKLHIVMIQKLLGHEDINTTMKYLGVSNAQKAEALGTIEDDVAKNAKKKWKGIKKSSSLAEKLGIK